jgi:3-hydroxyacyl-CoA dehydrogenase
MTAEEKDAVMGRITPTITLDAGADADIVIEAIIEDALLEEGNI